MLFEELEGKKILILGFGKEGMSTFRALKKYFPELILTVADRKKKENLSSDAQNLLHNYPETKLFLGENYLESVDYFDVIIKSPGIVWTKEIFEAEKDGRLTSATRIFFDTIGREKIIGVTGSKGKSTTASLLREVLKMEKKPVFLVGNVGNPAIDFIDIKDENALFVYELSSYQLEDLSVSPHIALWINFFGEVGHIHHHGNIENYFKAKSRIGIFQTKEDFFVFNAHCQELSAAARDQKSKKITYNDTFSYHLDGHFVFRGEEKVFSLEKIKLLGNHNKENSLAVLAVSDIFGLPREKVLEVINAFQPLAHRLEFIGTYKEIDFYNDSIATVPEAVTMALDTFQNKIGTLLLGGKENGEDFSEVGRKLFDYKIQNLIFIGESGKRIQKELRHQELFYEKRNLYEPKMFDVFSADGAESVMKKAVELAVEITPAGKICLLSPGAKSFDLFESFEHRGDLFRRLAKGIEA